MIKQKQQLTLMLIIGVLVGIALVTVWGSNASPADVFVRNTTPVGTTTKVTATDITLKPQEIAKSDISFPAQIPLNSRIGLSVPNQAAGNSVSVSSLNITHPQWIAVYDDTNGHPGWIMGATRVHEGDTSAVIELLRQEGTVVGHTYYVAILNDDGDDTFNRLTDLPPFSPENVIIVSFVAL